MKNRSYRSLAIPAITALFMAALALLPAPLPLPQVVPASFQPPAKDGLPAVKSFNNLKKLLRGMEGRGGYGSLDHGVGLMAGGAKSSRALSAVPESAADFPALDFFADTGGADFSRTNIQVRGVDESDIVKTDGRYIYTLRDAELTVVKATPPTDMAVLSRLNYGSENFYPTELYVDDENLIVIGQSAVEIPLPEDAEPEVAPNGTEKKSMLIEPGRSSYYRMPDMSNTTKIIIYDLSDKHDLKVVREAEIEGQYLSSRKIGSSLYIVTNKYVDMYRILNEPAGGDQTRPLYRDTAVSRDFKRIPYSRIKYFPEPSEPSYLMVAGLNLNRPDEQITVRTYLGAAQNIYSSAENLYVATVKLDEGTATATDFPHVYPARQKTAIYKFALADGNVNFAARGEASGAILNQFSMDEHEGFFRIATTKGYLGGEGEAAAKNNLYVLDAQLKTTGRLENVAPGEKIYSVRFMADRAYMVTFKNVDPLFVIDLKDATDPRILGELKIPGYSDYLHPYDANHIIGFGKEAVDARTVDGAAADAFAYYQGMKIAMFDVSDVEKPVEKFKTIIGNRGTDSELLRDHKALLFDKDKNLLAFPITVMEIKNKSAEQSGSDQAARYGEPTFAGAYVYDIDLRRGLKLRGKITHSPGAKQDLYGYDGYDNIRRMLYINDTLYSVSAQMIKSSELESLNEIAKLELR